MNSVQQESGDLDQFGTAGSVWCGLLSNLTQARPRHAVRRLNHISRQRCSKVNRIQLDPADEKYDVRTSP